jgi:hypothetical protein
MHMALIALLAAVTVPLSQQQDMRTDIADPHSRTHLAILHQQCCCLVLACAWGPTEFQVWVDKLGEMPKLARIYTLVKGLMILQQPAAEQQHT